jgi:hypothetical protein
MVNLDELARRARWTAERGRARMAARIAAIVLLLAGMPWLGGAAPASCAVLAGALFLLAFGLRLWHREGVVAVEMGLLMGSVPLLAALSLQTCGMDCASWDQLSSAEWACIFSGVLGGMGLAAHATSSGHSPRVWALATLVAAATASLGCVGLGLGGLMVTVGALVTSSTVTWVPLRARLA